MYQIWRLYLDLWGHYCKKWVWLTFGCKLGQSDPIVMQLKLDMSCHLLNVYTKFQIDISKHVEEKSGKRGRTYGHTDRRTDGHCHGIIRPFFKRAYKNQGIFVKSYISYVRIGFAAKMVKCSLIVNSQNQRFPLWFCKCPQTPRRYDGGVVEKVKRNRGDRLTKPTKFQYFR